MIGDLPVNSNAFQKVYPISSQGPLAMWLPMNPALQPERAMFRGFKVPFQFCSGFGLVKQTTYHPRLRDWNPQALLLWEFKMRKPTTTFPGSNGAIQPSFRSAKKALVGLHLSSAQPLDQLHRTLLSLKRLADGLWTWEREALSPPADSYHR